MLMIVSLATVPASAQVTGAAFTTMPVDSSNVPTLSSPDHFIVNANTQYPDKTFVFLNGGPRNDNSAGLTPLGTYYFQVTNPNGNVLLSADPAACRIVNVVADSNGHGRVDGLAASVIAMAGSCPTRLVFADPAHGSTNNPVQLCPAASNRSDTLGDGVPLFDANNWCDNTPNPGGEYKAFLIRTDKATVAGDGLHLTFSNSNSQTDNFKVKSSVIQPPPESTTGTLLVCKFFDSNADGMINASDFFLSNWPMSQDSNSANALTPLTQNTDQNGCTEWDNLTPGVYTVDEGIPTQTNWFNTDPGPISTPLTPGLIPPQIVAQTGTVVIDQTTELDFGNYCTAGSNGLTLGFWSNQNGQNTMKCGKTTSSGNSCTPNNNADMLLLKNLNLRNANGTDFDPSNYTAYRTWLLSASATNMAYMLSAQLSAMELNVASGTVDGTSFVLGFGGTINDLMSAADLALNSCTVPGTATHVSTCSVVASGATRTAMQTLKNYLDALNNGAVVIPSTGCPYTFPTN